MFGGSNTTEQMYNAVNNTIITFQPNSTIGTPDTYLKFNIRSYNSSILGPLGDYLTIQSQSDGTFSGVVGFENAISIYDVFDTDFVSHNFVPYDITNIGSISYIPSIKTFEIYDVLGRLLSADDTISLQVNGNINATEDINSSARICDGFGNCLNSVSGGNTTQEMINAVNNTALNLSNSYGYLWGNLIGRLITSVQSKWFSISSGELYFNETQLNSTIKELSINETFANQNYIKVNQSTYQTITDGIPLLSNNRNISNINHLVDKLYVDTVVSSLGIRFYMTNVSSGIETYYIACPLGCPSEDFSLTYSGLTNNQFIARWINPENMSMATLGAGIYDWHLFAAKTSGTRTLRVYWQLVERLGNGSEIIIETSANSNLLTSKSDVSIPLLLSSDYTLFNSSSRIVGKTYAVVGTSGSAPTITIYGGGNDNSHWEIPTNKEFLDSIYLGINDQRYNETTLILNINSTINTRMTANYNIFVSSNSTLTNKINSVNASLISNYVPYSGATNNVNLGSKNLTANKINATGDLFIGDDLTVNDLSIFNGALYGLGTSFFGDTTHNFVFGTLDLGAYGTYGLLGANSDGAFGNVGAIADSLIIYDTLEDNELTLNFVDNSVSSIAGIQFDFPTNTFNLLDSLGGGAKRHLTTSGNITAEFFQGDGSALTGISSSGNTTQQIITAANSTGLLIDWSYVDTDTNTWNTSDEMFNAANRTGLLINWSNVISVTGGGNTTQEMIEAVNNTALNLSNSFGYPEESIYWNDVISKPFTSLSSDFETPAYVLTINGTKWNATIRDIADQENISIVTYVGFNCSGVDGATGRVLNITKYADLVTVDRVTLNPFLDFVPTIGQVLFYIPISNSSNITVYTLRAGSEIANVSWVLAQNVYLQDTGNFYNSSQAEGAFAEIGNRLGSINTGNVSTVWKDPVKSKSVNTPPPTPVNKDRYIVPFATAGDWYGLAGEWDYRQKITLESDYVSLDSYNVIVPIKINNPLNLIFSHSQSDGDDIVFTLDDKTTKLHYELVSFNTTVGYEYLEAHVNLTFLNASSDTEMYVYYGNPSATTQSEPSKIWNDDYEAVFHADMTTISTFNDSSNNNYVAKANGYPQEIAGILGKAQYYDGVNDWTNTTINTDLSGGGAFTISAWFKDTNTGSQYLIAQAHTTPTYTSDWIVGYQNDGFWMRSQIISGDNILANGQWHKYDAVFNGTNAKLYIDSVLKGTVTPSGFGGIKDIMLFTRGDTLNRYKGTIDELRILTTDLSQAEINLSYQMIKNIDTFQTYGAEEISSATPTAWTGHIYEITEYNSNDANWTFELPSIGYALTVLDENLQYWYNGSMWIRIASGSHTSLGDLEGCDEEGNCWHFQSLAELLAATRDSTNVLNGLMPAGKLDFWDSAWHIGEAITDDIFIEDATPSLILQDTDDDSAYSLYYNAANNYLNISKGAVSEGVYSGTTDDAKVVVDGTIRAASSVITGDSYNGEMVSGKANLIQYILNGLTARILPFDGSSYYDLAIGDWNGGNPNIMLKTGGNVGISKGAPTSALQVGGTIKADKDINASNVVCDGFGNCLNTVDTNESSKVAALEIGLSNNATKLNNLDLRELADNTTQTLAIVSLVTSNISTNLRIDNLVLGNTSQEMINAVNTTFIPYTGANKNVNLNNVNLSARKITAYSNILAFGNISKVGMIIDGNQIGIRQSISTFVDYYEPFQLYDDVGFNGYTHPSLRFDGSKLALGLFNGVDLVSYSDLKGNMYATGNLSADKLSLGNSNKPSNYMLYLNSTSPSILFEGSTTSGNIYFNYQNDEKWRMTAYSTYFDIRNSNYGESAIKIFDTTTGSKIAIRYGTTQPKENFAVNGTGRFLDTLFFNKLVKNNTAYIGMNSTDVNFPTIAGIRMMWIPDKAAFRTGLAGLDKWNRTNIGQNSFASGSDTVASGLTSIAMGSSSQATNSFATSIGFGCYATGTYSTCIGDSSTSSSTNSIAIGQDCLASGGPSVAIGDNCDSTAGDTYTFGADATASHTRSMVLNTGTGAVSSDSINQMKLGATRLTTTATSFEIPSTGSIYLGEYTTEGTWRMVRSGNSTIFSRREGVSYTPKITFYQNGTIQAQDFITSSDVPEIQNLESYKENILSLPTWTDIDGKLVYENHYAYTTKEVEDISNPIITEISKDKTLINITTYPIITKKGLSVENRLVTLEGEMYNLILENEALKIEIEKMKLDIKTLKEIRK